MDTKELGLRIRRARTERNMSLAELAEETHVSEKTLDKWENGRRPPLYQMPNLSVALGGAELCTEGEVAGWRRELIVAHWLLSLCVLPFLIAMLALNLIPARFPLYAAGDSVVWGDSRVWAAIGLGVTAAAYLTAIAVLKLIRPGRVRTAVALTECAACLAASIALAVVLSQYASLASANGYEAAKLYPLTYLLAIAGAFYVLLGVWAPMLKKNLFLGVRCEGTLKDPVIWGMTHAFAFVHFQLCGLFCVAVCVFVPSMTGVACFVVGTFTMILFPILYATRKMLRFYPEMNAPPARKK